MLHTAGVSLSQTGQGSAPISEGIHFEMTSITDSGMIFTNDVRKKQFVMICAQTQKVNHFVHSIQKEWVHSTHLAVES